MEVYVKPISLSFLVILFAFFVAGCGKSPTGDAPAAIETYLQAVVSNDTNLISSLSCAFWEQQARMELNSFSAVTAKVDNPNCRVSGQEGDITLVSCSGNIVANYNGENQELALGDKVFKAVREGGEWRMCGYK
jgi:hypothetical protein